MHGWRRWSDNIVSSSDLAKTMPKMTLDHDGSPGLLFLDTNDAFLFKAP